MKSSLVLCALFAAAACQATAIQHRFLAFDEANPTSNWTRPMDGRARDIQLLGDPKVSVPLDGGYAVVNLSDGSVGEGGGVII